MHLLFTCVAAIKTKVRQVNQVEAADRQKKSLGFQVGGRVLVIRSIISALCTSPPNCPDKRRSKAVRATKLQSVPVDQVGTVLVHTHQSPCFRLSTSFYLQEKPPHKPNPNTIEV